MAAVAPVPAMNGNHEPEKDLRAEHSPSRFTAVNGRESAQNNTTALSLTPTVSKATESKEEGSAIRDIPGQTASSTRLESHQQDLDRSIHQVDEASVPPSPSASPNSNRNKRKRSESSERHLSPQSSSQSQIHSSPDHRTDEQSDLQVQNGSLNSSTHSHSTTQQNQTSTASSYPRADPLDNQQSATGNPSWSDYDSNLISQAQRAQTLDSSDAQLAEALQRETQGSDANSKSWEPLNRGSEGAADLDQRSYQNYTQDRPQAAVQVGPKRKRVFSNRTKTGCMTCRRRKKKCDEQHPACNNCIRGGFLCEGYSSRGTWQKPSNAKGPIPLQSKDGYSEMATHYIPDLGSARHERAPPTAQPLEAGKVRPVEDPDRTAPQYMTSPPGNAPTRGPWPKRTWATPGHPTYMSEHMPKTEYREVPPFHELSRDGQPKSDYPIVPPIRDLPHGVHPKPGIPMFPGNVDQRPPHTNAMDTSSPQAQARMALSIEHQLSTRQPPGEETERDKMIRGELYRPFDMQLVEDRERCKSALWRFNNACNPHSGVSTKEQNRLLRDILISPNIIASPQTVSPLTRPEGSIGQGAVVEAPFKCHYGYNIHIGEDVMISENCSLVDDCPINIGAHTWIGPNVTILGSMAHANMQERKGSQSRYQGRAVTIEEDCYVGANCIIYPGVRLRRGAYVAPGEVVKSDIVAYGFQGLKPSYM